MPTAPYQRLRGKFIVLDGVDGAGKGAQLARLEQALDAHDVDYVKTRDPGGTPIGDRIRHVLLDYDLSKMGVNCEALLFMASRAQLLRDVIRPALKEKRACLCDRYVSATCAYQGAAGYDPKRVVELAKFAIGDCWPALTIIIDMPPGEAFRRTGRQSPTQRKNSGTHGQTMLFHDVRTDAMEARPLEFHQRVREFFLQLPDFYPAPVAIVEGEGSVEEVHQRVLQVLRDAAL